MWPLTLIEVLAVMAFALSGAWRGREKGLDVFGVVMLAAICAFGGGWMRDLLLGRGVPVSLREAWYLPLAVGTGVFAQLFFRRRIEALTQAVNVLDAFGLGLYSASAAMLGLDAGLPIFSVCALAIVTGAGGGVLRDLIVNDIPLVFRREIYATCSILGALTVIVLNGAGASSFTQLLAGATVATALRIFALWKNWHLPRAAAE
ncbi:MAG: trimeric intracellular cation channel family protein [Verrucomicrobiae bacterium]|nr:trimeric intracellular cation channel family protein [Verrucomicrobiae bacterium]